MTAEGHPGKCQKVTELHVWKCKKNDKEYRKDATKYAHGSRMNVLRVLERLPKELNKRFHIADVKGGSPGEVVYMPAYFLMFLEHDGLPENVVYEIEL